MGKIEDILINKKIDYREKETNLYNLLKIEYYKPNIFN